LIRGACLLRDLLGCSRALYTRIGGRVVDRGWADTDSRRSSVVSPAGGGVEGALIAMGHDHLQEDKERLEEILGKLGTTNLRIS